MSFMLGGKQTVKKPLSVFFNWSHYLPTIIGFGSIHRLLPSLWISACTPYIISLFLFLGMTVIVNNGTEHVEQKRRALCGNKISCRRRSMVGAKVAPLHAFRIVIERKISVMREVQKEKTTPFSP